MEVREELVKRLESLSSWLALAELLNTWLWYLLLVQVNRHEWNSISKRLRQIFRDDQSPLTAFSEAGGSPARLVEALGTIERAEQVASLDSDDLPWLKHSSNQVSVDQGVVDGGDLPSFW